jgi:hypothetical protein
VGEGAGVGVTAQFGTGDDSVPWASANEDRLSDANAKQVANTSGLAQRGLVASRSRWVGLGWVGLGWITVKIKLTRIRKRKSFITFRVNLLALKARITTVQRKRTRTKARTANIAQRPVSAASPGCL